jgi:hypothetical protein
MANQLRCFEDFTNIGPNREFCLSRRSRDYQMLVLTALRLCNVDPLAPSHDIRCHIRVPAPTSQDSFAKYSEIALLTTGMTG